MIEEESGEAEAAFGDHSQHGAAGDGGHSGRRPNEHFYGHSVASGRRASARAAATGGAGAGTILARNLLAFWLLGLCNNFGYVVMLSAAKDILERSTAPSNGTDRCIDHLNSLPCSPISTGAVLLADILPSLAIKLVAPFTFHGVSYNARHSLVLICQASSFIIVAYSESFSVGLLGVIFASFGAGLGEVTYLSLSAHFHGDVISSWSSGTGGAGIFGALVFAVLTDRRLMALQPKNALLCMLLVPLLLLWTFWRLLHSPSSVHNRSPILFNTTTSSSIIESANVGHSVPVPSAVPSSSSSSDNDATPLISNDYSINNNSSSNRPPSAFAALLRKMFCSGRTARAIRPLLKYMVPLSVVYFSEYFINQGLLELLMFDCAHSFALSPASQYRWFQVLYQVGVFISRSSVKLFPVRTPFIPVLALLQVLNALFLFEESLALHIPHILPLMALLFYEGLLGGLAYVNTFAAIHRNVSKPNREFAMAFVALSDSVGIVLAGFSAIYAHNFICAHRRQ
uniref:Battenin n=1 Tax=Globodera rostochiensis TaxID=31243 RepID=A0A914HF81_GLORO